MQFDTLVQLQETNVRRGSGDDHVIKVLDRHGEIRVHFPAAPQTSFMVLGISLCCATKPRKYFLNAQESCEAEFSKHLRCTAVSEEAQLGQQMPSTLTPRATVPQAAGTRRSVGCNHSGRDRGNNSMAGSQLREIKSDKV